MKKALFLMLIASSTAFSQNCKFAKNEVDKLNILYKIKIKHENFPNDIKIDYLTKIKLDLQRKIYKSMDFFKKIYLSSKSKLWKLIHN